MKVVVGVDLDGHYASVLKFLGRLQFSVEETALLNVVEPIAAAMPYSAYGVLVETEDLLEAQKKASGEVLSSAEALANQLNLNPKTLVADGFPAQELTDYGAEINADLLCVTSTVTGTVDAVLGGSIARGLAISSKHSVLVARDSEVAEGGIKAVFAVDSSDYCEKCVEQLVEFAPKGIEHVILLTVKESHAKGQPSEGDLKAFDERLAALLKEGGIDSSVQVVTGRIEDSIHQVMMDTHADLLILGSQSLGLLSRLFEGSTALHEVIHEKYPVFLIRP